MSISAVSVPASTKSLLDGALKDASDCSDQVIGKNLRAVTVVHHDHHHYGWTPYYYGPSYYGPRHYDSCGSSRSSRQESGNENLIFIAITAAVAALAVIFSIGKSQAHLLDAYQKMDTMKQRQSDVDAELEKQPDLQSLRGKMGIVFDNQEQLLSHQLEKASTDLSVKKSFAVSAGVTGLGAVAEMTGAAAVAGLGTAAMCAGGVGLLGTGAVWLYRNGFNSSEASIQLEAEKLKQSVEDVRRDLPTNL